MAKSKYPIILARGIILKDSIFFKVFGKIQKLLKTAGYDVYISRTDSMGSIKTNALQLKVQIESILEKHGVDKVNIIGHSRGGLDARYMIEELGMEEHVASLTTISVPHKGSIFATKLCNLPKPVINFFSFFINLWYKIFLDKNPDYKAVIQELKIPEEYDDTVKCKSVYCQSYSSEFKRYADDMFLGFIYKIVQAVEKTPSDGFVSVESSIWAEYKGPCIDEPASHTQVVGLEAMVSKRRRQKIYDFYLALCQDLVDRGF